MYSHIRSAYERQVKPTWLPTSQRIRGIYNTIARPIHNPGDKSRLFEAIQAIAPEFDQNSEAILTAQETFHTWFMSQIDILSKVPFKWEQTDKGGANKTQIAAISFGAAQKCISLLIKDWWSISENAAKIGEGCAFLYAPFDGIVYEALRRYRSVLYASLLDRNKRYQSYVYHLSIDDYLEYQKDLAILADKITESLSLPTRLHRIEVEQIIWGWV